MTNIMDYIIELLYKIDNIEMAFFPYYQIPIFFCLSNQTLCLEFQKSIYIEIIVMI